MKFISEHGSTVELSGKHLGIVIIDLDWFEEEICIEAYPHFNRDMQEPMIEAYCDCCKDSPFYIPLKRVEEAVK